MKSISCDSWHQAAEDLTKRLHQELSRHQNVLWLLSGGSNIAASVQVMCNIPDDQSRHLSLLLADERFGPPGHADSNLFQLEQAGLAIKQADVLPVLRPSQTFNSALEHYQQIADQAFAKADVIIAQLGIGEDGHIAGILPNSPATKETADLALAYDSQPYQRLTLTFAALKKATVAFALAFGEKKKQAVQKLAEDRPLREQPAQILKQLAESYIYSDQIGGNA